MYITNPGTMQYLYIHTDEQTAVFVITGDKISTIYLTTLTQNENFTLYFSE